MLGLALAIAACKGGDASDDAGQGTDDGGSQTGSDTNGDGDGDGDGDETDTDEGTDTKEPKFDLPWDDLGGPGPGEMTCDNIDEFPKTSVGCEFFGVDVPMYSTQLPYGISVGNPSSEVATIEIEDMRGPGGTLREVHTFMLDPQDATLVKINGTGGILEMEGQHNVEPSGLNAKVAFRVTSDVPVTAMQINPVGGGPSAIAEASMLLPKNALDVTYLAVGYDSKVYASPKPGWIIVVATEDGTMVSTVEGDVMLDEFDAYYYAQGNDSTGFRVDADKPVAVFSGTECTFVPENVYACDHIEEQVLPLSAWGESYVGARHPQRIPEVHPEPENVYWRVISAVENTTVTFTPAQPGVGAQTVLGNPGEFVEFGSTESFVAEGDNPFMLVQYMAGCSSVIGGNGCQTMNLPSGDPYMAQTVPIDQWLEALPFLTDTSYPRDFVVVSREAGTEVTLDCLGVIPDDHFTPIQGTSYEVGYVDLDENDMGGEGDCVDGAQFLSASQPVGILVGGVDFASSYGYPGGLSLEQLWIPPEG